MSIEDAIRTRIKELAEERGTTVSALCLDSLITPSTISDFMTRKSKCPKVVTIKKLCFGANITLREFFDRDYFDTVEDILEIKNE